MTIQQIGPGVFGASFPYGGRELHVRMELLSEVNVASWELFKKSSVNMSTSNSRSLSLLVNFAGTEESLENETGFTQDEFTKFTSFIEERKKTDEKIVDLLSVNCFGSKAMYTKYVPDEENYIAYITKNPNFSITQAAEIAKSGNIKSYIEAYGDILISIGTKFTKEGFFWSRGISRNPYWVLHGKYSGLSMLLHGFTGMVAKQFYRDMDWMMVLPMGSMMAIFVKALRPTDGYIESSDGLVDLTKVQVDRDEGEKYMTHIKVDALVRIYQEQLITSRNKAGSHSS